MKQTFSLLCLCLLAWAPRALAQCEPVLTVHNGLAANLTPMDFDGDGTADTLLFTIEAADLVHRALNPCSTAPLEYRIRKDGTGTGAPTTTSVTFNRFELGTRVVEVWAGDPTTGSWTYCNTYLIVWNADFYYSLPPLSTACESDEIPPTIMAYNGLSASLLPDGAGGGTVKVTAANFRHLVRDNCPGPIRLRIRRCGEGSGVPPTSSVTFNCAPLSINTECVELWAGDGNGNWTFVETYIRIGDNNSVCGTDIPTGCAPDLTPPDVLVYDGLAQCISSNGIATVRAKPFLRQRKDDCPGSALKIRIARDDGATTPPTTTAVNFTCNELGSQYVVIWVGDEAGNWSRTSTYVIVQDPFLFCGIGPKTAAVPDWKPGLTNPQLRHNTPSRAVAPEFGVQPNPTSGAFAVTGFLENAGFARFELYNAYGQKIRTLAERAWLPNGEFRFDFETGELPAGLYRCVMRTDGLVRTVSLVKN